MDTSVTNGLLHDPQKSDRWRDVRRFTDRSSLLAPTYFVPSPDNMSQIQQMRILVVGAGGLGCELLKCLALSGFVHIDVIDMDTIDLTNLNRQFLFRESDIGSSKAEVAARFINERVSGAKVVAHNCAIQTKDEQFYRQFNIVICGLDSVSARRWLNATLVDLVKLDANGQPDPNTIVPLIDGGTEGFKGNARVIYPRMTPCVECTLDLYPQQVNYPMCTIAHTPRLPEHCVEYVKVILWPDEKPFDDVALDADDPAHVEWVLERAEQRARQYNISGVDRRLVQGVLKRIIPAVASTNAVIAAMCATEALKLASNIAMPLNNYLNFMDAHGAHVSVVELERKPDCVVCGTGILHMEAKVADTFGTLFERITAQLQLKQPTISLGGNSAPLYMINAIVPELEAKSKKNLERTLEELGITGDTRLVVGDESLTQAVTVQLAILSPEDL